MTIEFHCPFCQKLLRTADDKAGVRANCPGCGEPVVVPVAAESSALFHESLPSQASGPATAPQPPLPAAEPHSGIGGATKNCPMCGAEIELAAKSCRFCGEVLVEGPPFAPTRIQTEDVLSRTWEIYQKRFGLVIGSMLIMLAIWVAEGAVLYAALIGLMVSMIGAGARQGVNPQQFTTTLYGVLIVVMPLVIAINSFFDAGFHLLRLRLAREQPADVTDLFAGGRFFGRTFLANLAFGLSGLLGALLQNWIGGWGTAIGWIVQLGMLLIFWPCVYLVVDRNLGVVEAFQRSASLTAGNYPPIVLLGLVAVLLQICGTAACCVGLIFTLPFMWLQFAVAYCRMTGQAVARS